MLDEIIKAYDSMLNSARNNRWDQVQSKELEVRSKIQDIFSELDEAGLSENEIDAINNIELMNEKLLEMASYVKSDFIKSLSDTVKSTRALQSYEKHKNI